ncbi:MAG: four helix bundle protein [Caldilineales bacterium]
MERSSYAKSFDDLFAYQQARTLTKDIFEISKRFPREETYALTGEIRRSSRSMRAQIAAIYHKRFR